MFTSVLLYTLLLWVPWKPMDRGVEIQIIMSPWQHCYYLVTLGTMETNGQRCRDPNRIETNFDIIRYYEKAVSLMHEIIVVSMHFLTF